MFDNSQASQTRFARWRRIHLLSTGLVILISLAHLGFTPFMYSNWSPDAVLFFGTGLGLLLLGTLNLTHIGIEPCRDRAPRLVRSANWAFVVFSVGASFAVPEPQAYAIVLGLMGQALASRRTLPGPDDHQQDETE